MCMQIYSTLFNDVIIHCTCPLHFPVTPRPCMEPFVKYPVILLVFKPPMSTWRHPTRRTDCDGAEKDFCTGSSTDVTPLGLRTGRNGLGQILQSFANSENQTLGQTGQTLHTWPSLSPARLFILSLFLGSRLFCSLIWTFPTGSKGLEFSLSYPWLESNVHRIQAGMHSCQVQPDLPGDQWSVITCPSSMDVLFNDVVVACHLALAPKKVVPRTHKIRRF